MNCFFYSELCNVNLCAGLIDREELETMLQHCDVTESGMYELDDGMVKDIFNQADKDGSGFISKEGVARDSPSCTSRVLLSIVIKLCWFWVESCSPGLEAVVPLHAEVTFISVLVFQSY